MIRRFAPVLLVIPAMLSAQATHKPADPWAALLRSTTHTPAPTTAAITAADLRTRLFIFAADSMMGREAGTEGNVKGVEYIASELKRFGLLPAGQDGTYFQTFVHHSKVRWFDSTHTISAGGVPLVMWHDYLPRDPVLDPRSLDNVPVIYGGDWKDSTSVISSQAAAGKFVIVTSSVTYPNNPPNIPSRQDVSNHFADAAGIAVAELDAIPESARGQFSTPSPFFHGRSGPIYMYMTHAAAERLVGQPLASAPMGTIGATLNGGFAFREGQVADSTAEPLRNVVALIEGSDPVLRNQFVILGAHNDHIGTVSSNMSDIGVPMAHDSIYVVDHLFRKGGADDPMPTLDPAQQQQVNAILAKVRKESGGGSARIDSIFNGADDDGSGSVSLLEIAQYFAAQPVKPRRSLLFVWHVGEEKGLWGSEYFSDHPTVPRDSIVAELNMDMVGRGGAADQTGNSIDGKHLHGGPGYLQVVGSRRLSTELGDLVESVNKSGHHGLDFDYSMDANGHPQNIYCRSDHAEYARYGIPIAFFTTGGHADYHQLTDEPEYIDYNRMAQVDNFLADLARHVANLDHRVMVDHAKPDPGAACKQ